LHTSPRQEKSITRPLLQARVPFYLPVPRTGPLAGSKGRILHTASGLRFAVRVGFIRQGTSVLAGDFRPPPAAEEVVAPAG
jgi:hypothetical protein